MRSSLAKGFRTRLRRRTIADLFPHCQCKGSDEQHLGSARGSDALRALIVWKGPAVNLYRCRSCASSRAGELDPRRRAHLGGSLEVGSEETGAVVSA